MGLLKELIDAANPTKCHHLLKALLSSGLLARLYTQNIDGLENKLGFNSTGYCSKTTQAVLLHGNMDLVRCMICKSTAPFTSSIMQDYQNGNMLECIACAEKNKNRILSGRRSTSIGHYRPDIILYNEAHPQGDDISSLLSYDLAKKPDALIVMGTSMKVAGIKKMIKDIAKVVKLSNGPIIYINKTKLATLDWKPTFTQE